MLTLAMIDDRSRSIKTQAVVLRRVEYGEADLVLTLFTPHHGKLNAIAKGVRRPTSKLAGHVELYHLSEMLLSRGRDLHIVSQVSLINPFLPLGQDLEHIGYASHFAELIDRFTLDNEENRAAFHMFVRALGWLCAEDTDLKLAARYFELKLLVVMGYTPSLFVCAMSGNTLTPRNHFYSATDGGVVSYDYGKDYGHMIPLPLPVFKILRHFSRHQWEEIRNLQISPHHHAILERVLQSTIAYLMERNLQSIDFLKRIATLQNDSK